MGREVCLTIPYVLSSTRIKDQPMGRQVCLTIPIGATKGTSSLFDMADT